MIKSPHINLAHAYWKKHLKPGMIVVDATIGNGKDTLILAKAVLENDKGEIYGFDIQKQALVETNLYLEKHLGKKLLKKICLFNQSHENFDDIKKPLDLVVYNLGYLPKGNKSITTMVRSTITSIQSACNLLNSQGLISITCYPGHEEGQKELLAIQEYLKTLSSQEYLICSHKWINRPLAPVLIILEKY